MSGKDFSVNYYSILNYFYTIHNITMDQNTLQHLTELDNRIKKNGFNKDDLLKVIHYGIIALSIHENRFPNRSIHYEESDNTSS